MLRSRILQRVSLILFLASTTCLAQEVRKNGPQAGWRVHEAKATDFLISGQPESAVEEYAVAIKLAPEQVGLHEELGDAEWASSRMTDAAPSYEAELVLDPQCASSLFKLGSLEVIRSNPGTGVVLLRRALEIDPTLMVARYYLGRGEAAEGAYEKASADLHTVLSTTTDPSLLSMTWYQLSVLNRKTGNLAASESAINKFKELRDQRTQSMSPEPIVPADRKRELPHKPPSPM